MWNAKHCKSGGTEPISFVDFLCIEDQRMIVEIMQISCDEFLPLPEHYRECEGSEASCVSTLGRFDRAVVESKECGPGPRPGHGPGQRCNTRVLGGGARVTVCHCRDNFCNKYSVQVSKLSG